MDTATRALTLQSSVQHHLTGGHGRGGWVVLRRSFREGVNRMSSLGKGVRQSGCHGVLLTSQF